MPAVNDVVEFTRKMKFGAQEIYKGTRGIVTQTVGSSLLWVSVPALRREVLVGASDVQVITNFNPGVTAAQGQAMSRFAVGDSVQAVRSMQFGNDQVAAGTRGKVTQVVVLSVSCQYWVRFTGMNRDVLVAEADLA